MKEHLDVIFQGFNGLMLKFGGWLAVFLAPVKSVMLAISALILFDLITGIWAAIKAKRKITSNGIRRTVSKTLAYQMAVISSFLMESYFLPELPVVRVVGGLIAVTEFKSFLENVGEITGLDLWDLVLKRIQGKKLPIASALKEEPKPEPVQKKKTTRRRKKTGKKKVRRRTKKS